MENNLTKTQLFMIEKIEEAIKKEEELLSKAGSSDKPRHQLKLKQLNDQLKEAKKPFTRSEDEKALINKIANKVKGNVEIMTGKKIEGDRSDKPLTSKEEFEHGVSMFLEEINLRREQLLKTIPVHEGIIKMLEDHDPIGDEEEYKSEILARKNILSQMKMSLELFEDRIRDSGIQEWAFENYDKLSELNKFLNNPLKLKDYEEYAVELKKKYNL